MRDEDRKQDARMQIRCSNEDKELLKDAAKKRRRSLSSFVVDAAVEKAERVLGVERE